MELLFGFVAGLLTLINPCILPMIPVALASGSSDTRAGPIALVGGMVTAIVVVGMLTASIGPAIGLTADAVTAVGAFMAVVFGIAMLLPQIGQRLAYATSALATVAVVRARRVDDRGVAGQFVGGALLGAIWSPCIGPTLGAAIALASQGGSPSWAGAVMLSFALGVANVMLALAYGTQAAVRSRGKDMARMARWSQPVLGASFVFVGTFLLLRLNHAVEAALLDLMPVWLQDLSVSF